MIDISKTPTWPSVERLAGSSCALNGPQSLGAFSEHQLVYFRLEMCLAYKPSPDPTMKRDVSGDLLLRLMHKGRQLTPVLRVADILDVPIFVVPDRITPMAPILVWFGTDESWDDAAHLSIISTMVTYWVPLVDTDGRPIGEALQGPAPSLGSPPWMVPRGR